MRLPLVFTIPAVALLPCAVPGQSGPQHPDSTPVAVVRYVPADVPMLNVGTDSAPLPAVVVMVNGRGPFRFGIETGARFLVITADAARRAGIAAADSTGPVELHADSITIGDLVLGPAHLTVLPRSARGVDGLLGLPAFQNLLLTIDYPAARVRLSRGALPAPDGATILALSRAADFWALPVSYAGHAMTTILDTRSTGAFSLDPKVESLLPWKSAPAVIGRAGGAGIPTTTIRAGVLDGDVIVGRYHLASPTLVLHELPPAFPSEPRLGARVLRGFVITLDQRNGRLRLLEAPT